MAQATYVDPEELARRQAARRNATGTGAPSIPSIATPTATGPQAVANPPAPAFGNADIAARVDDIRARAAGFRQQVTGQQMQNQMGRAPGLAAGAPAGPTSSLDVRGAGTNVPNVGPTSAIPTQPPVNVSIADFARNAPDSALARRVPGAAFETAQPSVGIDPVQQARANYNLGRVAGTNPTVPPAQPGSFGTTTPPPAAAAAAPAAGPATPPLNAAAQAATAAAPAASAAGRAVGAVGRTVGRVGRAAGYIGAATEAVGAVGDAAQGQYGDAAIGAGLAGLDIAAVRAPNPLTVGAAVTGHVASAAANTDIAQAGFRNLANALPGSGARTADASIADLEATMADRKARGLPIPAGYDAALKQAQGYAAGIRNEPSPGLGQMADLISPGISERSRAANVASIAPPSTPGGGGPISTATATSAPAGGTPSAADEAMRSNKPGTAVINGRVISADDVTSAGNRLNTVPASSFTNPSIGDIYSQLNSGATPTPEQAASLRASLAAPTNTGGGGGNFADFDRSRLIRELRADQQNRTAEMRRLTGLSETALAQGRKRAAGVFAGLAQNYNASDPNYAAYLSPQARPTTPGEAALEQAQAGDYAARTADTLDQIGNRRKIASITDSIGTETDPKKRDALVTQLNALTGRANQERAYTLDVPSQDVDANGAPVKYQLLVSPDGTVLYDPRGTMTGKKVNDKAK